MSKYFKILFTSNIWFTVFVSNFTNVFLEENRIIIYKFYCKLKCLIYKMKSNISNSKYILILIRNILIKLNIIYLYLPNYRIFNK